MSIRINKRVVPSDIRERKIMMMQYAALPFTAFAQEPQQKVVRVGWYESAFHHTDEFGRRSGYGYEYQKRVAIYTGWTYEYVEGSWSELLEMLIAGEIDLLTDVSYTEERAEKILYSTEAMGSEGYHVFIAPDNTEIRPDDFSTLNGKRVGVNKNSIQEQLFLDWAENHGVTPEIVESTEKTPVLLDMLSKGEFDALVTLDTNQELTEKFNRATSVNSFLTAEEKDWVSEHGTIRVGYRDNYLPFGALDEETQMLTGSLADYLEFAETAEKNARLSFETKVFNTTGDALQALEKGEIDCVFPLSLSSYDGEKYGVIITDPFVSTEMYAVVRTADHQGISREQELTVAVIRDNPNYITFLSDNFPNWKTSWYDNTRSAFQAVADEKADAVLVSNYRISRVSDLIEKYRFSALTTGQVMDISFAVRQEDDCLYSILNKITGVIPDATINALLTNYSFRDEKITFGKFIRDNLLYFIAAVAMIAVIILLLVIRNLKIKAKEEEGRQIISETERDPLTDLYNWNFFLVYAGRLYHEHPEKPMDAVVMNINRFHSVNALHGREFGDSVLRAFGQEINNFLRKTEGIASRFEADRFYIYCKHRDDW